MANIIAKYGDNYSDLAKRFNLDAFELRQYNQFSQLNPGQSVRVPSRRSGSDRSRRSGSDRRGNASNQGVANRKQPKKARAETTVKPVATNRRQPKKARAETTVKPSAAAPKARLTPVNPPDIKPPKPTEKQPDGNQQSYYDAGLGVVSQAPSDGYYDAGLGVVSQAPSPTNPPSSLTPGGHVPGSWQDEMFGYLQGQNIAPASPGAEAPPKKAPLAAGDYGSPQYEPQQYVDTIRVPGQAPTTIRSWEATPEGTQQNFSGTFSDTTIEKWQQYYGSAYQSMPGIDTYVQQYTKVYEAGLQDMFAGYVNAYGEIDALHVPNALLTTIDGQSLDPKWFAENAEALAGLSVEEQNYLWLHDLGYNFSEEGNYLEFDPEYAEPEEEVTNYGAGNYNSGSGSGGGGGGGGGGYYNPYPSGQKMYGGAVTGLINWRNVGFA